MSEMSFYKFFVRDNLIIDTKHDIHTTGDNTDNHDDDDNCHLVDDGGTQARISRPNDFILC